MPLSDKQKELVQIRNLPNTLVVVHGGVRSGKTHFASTLGFFELIIKQQSQSKLHEGNQYMVIGAPSAKNAYINVTARIVEYAKLRGFKVKKIRPQNFDYEFTRDNIKFTIDTYAANTEFSYQQWHGRTIRSVFIDEASIIDRRNIESAIDRTLSFPDAKIIMTANPMGSKNHWFYQTYIQDHHLKGIKVFHLTLLDNPIIDQLRIEQYKKIFTPSMYAQRVLGQWVIDEGMVYKTLPGQLTPTIKPKYIYFGLDYGEADATSVMAIGYFKEDNQQLGYYVILDQYYHSNKKNESKQNSITDYQQEVVEFMNSVHKKYNVKCMLFCETSPISMYNLLRRDLSLHQDILVRRVSKKKTDYRSKDVVQERIDIVNLLINNDRLFIRDKDLPVYQAFMDAQYDKNGRRLDDGSTDIDSLDSLEYALKIDFKIIMKEMGYEVSESEGDMDDSST